MSKRFTATEKWLDPWFCSLSITDRLFWIYLCDNCDHSGVWQVNTLLVQTYFPGYTPDSKVFGDRLRVLTTEKWFLTKFADFQYGTLNPANRMHLSVIARLEKEGAYKVHTSPLQGAKDKVKEQGSKDVGGSGGFNFDAVWVRYPRKLGRKDALRHFKASVKTPQDYLDLQNAMDCFIREIRKEGRPDDKIPYGSSWFNGWRDWINYGGVQMPKPPPPKPRPPEPPAPDLTEDDLKTMHNQKVATLGPCRDAECRFCKAEVNASV